jgi:hypothetical protein
MELGAQMETYCSEYEGVTTDEEPQTSAASPTNEQSPVVSEPPPKTTVPDPAASECDAERLPPETASQCLYRAWKADNRTAAEKVASTTAVDQLFAAAWEPPDWDFRGCDDGTQDEGGFTTFTCSFTRGDAGLRFVTTKGTPSLGYPIDSVTDGNGNPLDWEAGD